MIRFCLLTCCVALASGCSEPSVESPPNETSSSQPHDTMGLQGQLIDLTHTFDENTIYWPGGDNFHLRKDFAGMTDKGYYYTANTFTTAEHGGTHIDAPIHFFVDRDTVDQIPLERLVGEAVVVDVRDACAKDADYQIGVADLRAWEEQHERQLVDVIVLLRTGWSQFWPDHQKYLGTSKTGEAAKSDLHFPGLAPEAAKWLAEQRSIKAIGIDTPSIDHGQSTHFQSHVTLFKHNIPALENLNLKAELPSERFTLLALPIKIGGGSGGPTRVVAVVPESE